LTDRRADDTFGSNHCYSMNFRSKHFNRLPAHPHGYLVAKFGGTSVATRAGWDAIEAIVTRHRRDRRRVIVVCSAAAGVTDRLSAAADRVAAGEDASRILAEISGIHRALAAALGVPTAAISADEHGLAAACARPPTPAGRASILAHGELISTRLGATWLAARGLAAAWVDARTLLRAAGDSDRDDRYLSARCATRRGSLRGQLDGVRADVLVTQGFIAGGDLGETVLLGRGGSDTSAAYLAAGAAADVLEIWTDVPGVFTADPRRVPGARLVRRLSYGEAEAVGALGAKVVHPRTIEPAHHAGVPIRSCWTARSEVEGTRIDRSRPPRGAKAIVSRSDLALVTMWRRSSWQPVGFMAEVAARFQRHGLSMDLIASSPSEIRATIDLAAFPSARRELDHLCADLEEVCHPRVLPRVACVSVVGAGVTEAVLAGRRGFGAVDAALHLVSHAADGRHVSVVVDPDAAAELVASAHRDLLAEATDDSVFGPSWTALATPPAKTAAESDPAARASEEACA
jgi:bifunctional diaminopimelate decarboxylase / aspartate kinase